MKCPNCGYVDGYYWNDKDKHVKEDGVEGEFFRLPIKLERSELFAQPETARVCGCPKCKIIFMEEL